MSKLNIILIGIAIFAFAAAGVNAYLGYTGNEVIANHYMTDHEWDDASCGGCHFNNVYEHVESSYHVQTDVNEWSPLTNFDIEVEGEDVWARQFGQFHVGGGPMEEYGVDIACMVCHEQSGGYDFDARAEAIRNGNFENANDIAIRDVRTSVQQSPLYMANYMLDVLTPAPMVLLVHDPINKGIPTKDSCADCHVEEVETGAVTWADEIHEEVDVHAEVECAECHEAVEHQIGRTTGEPASEEDVHEEAEGEILDCLSCHEGISHGPVADAHLEFLECESCHVPMLPGGKLEGGMPLESFTWANGEREDNFRESDFVPTLAWSNGQADDELPMADGKEDPDVKLAPFNVVEGSWWDEGIDEDVVADPDNSSSTGDAIPVPHVTMADADGDGVVTEEEMRSVDVDGDGTPDYPNAILRNVDLYYRVSHNIAGAEVGLADPYMCAGCHGSTSYVDWQFLGYEKDPAQTDPPTDFTQKSLDVTVPRQKPDEVEREPAF